MDYAALRASALYREAGERARRLPHLDPAGLPGPQARLAFWIDLYNALVRRSVWQVWNFFGRVSDRVGSVVLSVDEVEHGILRGNRRRVWPPWRAFGRRDARHGLALDSVDPRIHFAINCGASSCPLVGVCRPDAVDAPLDLAARSFVNQETSLDDERDIACSKILKWYRADFEAAGGLTPFLQRYLDAGPETLTAGAAPCRRWRPYSWALPHPPVE